MSRLYTSLFTLVFSISLSANSIMNVVPNMTNIQLRSDGSAVVAYTVTNNTASATLPNITIDFGISGGNSNGLSAINNTCTNAVLVPSASCTFQALIQGEDQPLDFILSPRACSQNVCSQATAGNRPSVTVIPITHPVRAYLGLYDTSNAGNPLNNQILPIDILTQAFSPTAGGFNFHFSIMNLPSGAALSPDGNTLYLTNVGDSGLNSNTLSIVDVSGDTPVPTTFIPVGNEPTFVSVTPDNSKLYVASPDFISGNGTVSVIDVATQTVSSTIPLPSFTFPLCAVMSPDGATVYVTTVGAGIFMIDTSTDTLNPTPITGNPPFFISEFTGITPDGTRLYVPNFGDGPPGTVSVVDTSDPYGPSPKITVGVNPTIAIVSPDGTRVYVANYDNSGGAQWSISVIDTASNTVIETIPLIAQPGGLSLTPDGSQLYVDHPDVSYINIINTSDYSIQTVNTGAGSFVAGSYIG